MILNKELIKACDNIFDSDTGRSIYNNIMESINSFGMLELIKKGTIVGFSGGADSVLLLIFLRILRKKHNFRLKAVHVNHKIRGLSADKDEEFSKEFAKLLDIEFSSYSFDVPKISSQIKKGTEETARIVRYEAFENCINDDFKTIATAHNATDNTETFIFNFLRGSGTLGLSAISPTRDNIVRPLISVSKSDIVKLLSENVIPYCTDETNFSCEYSRNYIRHEILPKFTRLHPDPDAAAAKSISNLRCDYDFIEKYSVEFFREHYKDGKIKTAKLKELHKAPFIRVIKKMMQEVSGELPEKVHYDKIYECLQKGNDFEVDLPDNKAFYSANGFCFIVGRYKQKENKDICIKLENGFNVIDDLNIAIGISDSKYEDFSSNVYNFSIQANILSAIIIGEIYLRTRKDGDFYFYGGMTRKLKKLFNDKKIPKNERDLIPVICDSKGIIWVPGFGVRDDNSENKTSKWITLYKKVNQNNS